MEDNKKNIKRLTVEIESAWHKDIKTISAIHNIPMRKYVTRAVMRQINEDKKVLERKPTAS